MANSWWEPGNWYGSDKDWWDTGLIQDDVLADPESNRGVWERYLTGEGFGGFGRNDQAARKFYSQSLSGLDAARLSNPSLTYYDYLQGLGPGFINRQIMNMTPQQRGDYIPGRTTWLRR